MGMESVFRLSVILGMVDNLTGGMSRVQGQVSGSIDKLNQGFNGMIKVGTGMAAIGAGITGAALSTVSATFETQDALAELKSLGVTDLKAVENAAKSFSDTWAGTTKSDFISASYDIKSGIASLTDEGVAKYTELSGLTAKATKSTVAEMTSLFATGYGIYKDYYSSMSDLEFGEMFSAGISSAVKSFKTTGSEMASSISTLGASATSANVPLEEQLTILGMMQATMSGSEAGTKYKAFLTSAASAGKALGLTFTDSNNQLMSLPEILDKLKGKYGETIDAVEKQELKTAFGTDEAVSMIDLLYGKTDSLQNNILDMYDSMGSGTDVATEMATAISDTPAQKLEVIKQKIHNNVEELGNGLLPTVNSVLEKVENVISKGSQWVQNNQNTVASIMQIILKIGVFLTVAGSMSVVMGTIGKSVITVINVVNRLKGIFQLLGIVFSSTPIGWIVLGILAVVAAVIYLWNTSSTFRNLLINIFESIKNAFIGAWSNIEPALVSLGKSFLKLYEAVKPILKIVGNALGAVFVTALGIIVGVISGILNALAPLISAFQNLIDFATNVINGIVALFQGDFEGAVNYFSSALDDINNFFVNGFDAILSFISGFAEGFINVISGAFSAVGINISDKLNGVKETVSGAFGKVKGVFRTVMQASADTTKEKLNDIKTAFKNNGGGVKGAVAAALTGVKGLYTAGFTFIDKLTGGKLTGIKNKFTTKFKEIIGVVGDKVTGIKEKVSDGIDKTKTVITNALSWFKDSGKKVMSTFTEGIQSAVSQPVEAVKGGLQKIRNMLPFSDAKTGPLSQLTKSGKKVFQTIDTGMQQTKEIPGKTAKEGFRRVSDELSINNENIADTLNKKKVSGTGGFSKIKKDKSSEKGEQKVSHTVIQKLEIKLDISNLKDLPMLFKLIDEIKDAENRTEENSETVYV